MSWIHLCLYKQFPIYNILHSNIQHYNKYFLYYNIHL
nr:MAG TPA: hypothetical protein [Caudoviricetes sp.]